MAEYPRLRSVEAFPFQQEGRTFVCVRDPLRIAQPLVISPAAYFILCHLDGQHSLVDIQEAYCRQFGELLFSEQLKELIDHVDTNFFLYNQRFLERQSQLVEDFRALSTRAPAHAGTVYKQNPRELETQLNEYFLPPNGPGDNCGETLRQTPRAVVAPHIDFHRGGPWYAWVYRELANSEGADLYVLLGTSHCGGATPFILTMKDFETPFGLVETDRDFIEQLQQKYRADLFFDEYLHRSEHSLEFQVVFLKHVARLQERRRGKSKPFKIVPILVSSFQPMISSRTLPEKEPRIGDFLQVLRDQVNHDSRSVCFIAGVDLAHVGAQFGDRDSITPSFLNGVEAEDRRLIERLIHLDGPGFFDEVAKDEDRRRICGFAPLYSLIRLLDGNHGRLLQYKQAFTPETGSAVSFTSVVFD